MILKIKEIVVRKGWRSIFSRYLVCPYCGRVLAWRWMWDLELVSSLYTKTGLVTFYWVPIWRERFALGACPCKPPAMPPGGWKKDDSMRLVNNLL